MDHVLKKHPHFLPEFHLDEYTFASQRDAIHYLKRKHGWRRKEAVQYLEALPAKQENADGSICEN